MNKPIITWYTRINDEAYESVTEFYAGTYTKTNKISVDIQLWNNKWGDADVEDLKDFSINLFFDNLEDNSLLKYCRIIMNGNNELSLNISNNKAVILFPENVIIKGTKNNGSIIDNKDNYLYLTLQFDAEDYNLKEKDLKTLCFEIITL